MTGWRDWARAALRALQVTIAGRAPVQAQPGLPECRPAGVNPCTPPNAPRPPAHPARLILILSLAPTVGLGIGRFAYALVLPDMRDALVWSYSAAGFMNTINAAGYLVGALLASRLIRRFGLAASVRWGTLACVVSLALCAVSRQFRHSELCPAAGRPRRRGRVRRRRRAGGDHRAIASRAGQFPAQPVLCRTGNRHPVVRTGRAVRAAGVRAGIMVDRVVGDDPARDRHDRSLLLAPIDAAAASTMRRPPNSRSGRC